MSEQWRGGSTTRWRTFRISILERDRWRCTLLLPGCTATATQVDHITPLSRGGDKYDPANCRASCASCNQRRGNSGSAPQPEHRVLSTWA
jgi:5-methylcytosine-specific restriction endonuclease McrA